MRSDLSWRWLTALLLSCALTNCASRTDTGGSIAEVYGEPDDELDFWQGLEDEVLLTHHDAVHGLLLLTEGGAVGTTYAERCREAVARGWWPAEVGEANESIPVGTVAVALWEILDPGGSVGLWMLGPSPRRCLRVLIAQGFLPSRSSRQSMRGSEFIELVARAADHLDAHETTHVAMEAGGSTP